MPYWTVQLVTSNSYWYLKPYQDGNECTKQKTMSTSFNFKKRYTKQLPASFKCLQTNGCCCDVLLMMFADDVCWWCLLMMFYWWCFTDDVCWWCLLMMFYWWCFADDVLLMMFYWWVFECLISKVKVGVIFEHGYY